MQRITTNLFNSLQKNLIEAVQLFLSKKLAHAKNEIVDTNKLTPLSLRIPTEVKEFFECVADKTNQSLNGIIVNVLEKAKEETLAEYTSATTRIQQALEYEINSFLQILEENKVEYNNIPTLLSSLSAKKIKESDIIDSDKLFDLITKPLKERVCQIFDYNYHWLQDNSYPKQRSEGENRRWYKNIQGFVDFFLRKFYLDDTVESFNIGFLLSNETMVQNIKENNFPESEDMIVVYITANRNIGGIKFVTYYRCESGNVNYWGERKNLISFIKTLMAIRNKLSKKLEYPSAYLISKNEFNLLIKGDLHISGLFNHVRQQAFHYIDDLNDLKIDNNLKENEAEQLILEHFLNIEMLMHIQSVGEKSTNHEELPITEDLAMKFKMSKNQLKTYLSLYNQGPNQKSLLNCKNPEETIIHLDILKKTIQQMEKMNKLHLFFE